MAFVSGHFECSSHLVVVIAACVIIWAPVVYPGDGTPLQYSCLENPMGGGTWWAVVHGVAKSRTWLSEFTFTFHFHALEKEMAIHSNVLAWRMPGMGKPGGMPSMGLHRVGHDWSDLVAAAAAVYPGTGEPGGLPSLGLHRVGHYWSDLAAAVY